jgi:hypothetical protein
VVRLAGEIDLHVTQLVGLDDLLPVDQGDASPQ